MKQLWNFISGPQWVLHSVTVQTNSSLFLLCVSTGLSLHLPNTFTHSYHTHTHTAVGQISPREKRTSTTPRSPVRPWTPAPLQLLPSRLWARPRPLISAGPPAVLPLPRGSRSPQLTGPGPTPAPGPARAGPVRSASRPPAASGRSTQSISIRWVQQRRSRSLRSVMAVMAIKYRQEKCVHKCLFTNLYIYCHFSFSYDRPGD